MLDEIVKVTTSNNKDIPRARNTKSYFYVYFLIIPCFLLLLFLSRFPLYLVNVRIKKGHQKETITYIQSKQQRL